MLLPFIFLPLTISSLLERDSEVSGALPNQWRALPEPTIPTKHTPVTVILRIWKVKVKLKVESESGTGGAQYTNKANTCDSNSENMKSESGKWKWNCIVESESGTARTHYTNKECARKRKTKKESGSTWRQLATNSSLVSTPSWFVSNLVWTVRRERDWLLIHHNDSSNLKRNGGKVKMKFHFHFPIPFTCWTPSPRFPSAPSRSSPCEGCLPSRRELQGKKQRIGNFNR